LQSRNKPTTGSEDRQAQEALAVEINYGGVRVKSKGAGPSNQHIHDLAAVPVGSLENDNFIAPCAPSKPLRIPFAGAFDENLYFASDQRFVAAASHLVDES
jgi:hypothetical protein